MSTARSIENIFVCKKCGLILEGYLDEDLQSFREHLNGISRCLEKNNYIDGFTKCNNVGLYVMESK